ncbi:MAG: glycoside hydrolase family 26 protein, partial [Chloroflexi bacterium]|nr:glycoside hydrolase family 26 protein [Chloroflexota bacterium]
MLVLMASTTTTANARSSDPQSSGRSTTRHLSQLTPASTDQRASPSAAFKAFLPLLINNPSRTLGTGAIYWGAILDGVPWDMTKQDQFEAAVGKRASLIPIGGPWKGSDGQYASFPTSMMETIRQRGAFPILTWQSTRDGYGDAQPEFKLTSITSGTHDGYIRSWAQAAKAWGKPFFLRFDHEMNGYWGYPWIVQKNGNQPADFAPMWRHVRDLFTQEGVSNVSWVWCPNIEDNQTTPLGSLYPGDAYVDWTCLDGYNWAQTQPDDWRSFTETFTGNAWRPYNSYQAVLNLAPNKPMMIGETATNEFTGDGGVKKAEWIRNLLATEFPNTFPKVRAFMWWNIWVAGNPPFPLDSSQAATDAFKTGIASTYY